MIYAFIGQKESGKSTACTYVESRLKNVARINFKDGLVEELLTHMNGTISILAALHGYSDTRSFITAKPTHTIARELLKDFGMMRRSDHPDYWVRKWAANAQYRTTVDGSIITVDDCRFLNEAAVIKQLGGVLIRLRRSDLPLPDNHPSELEQLEIEADYTIDCVKDNLEALHSSLDAIIEKTRLF